MKIERNSLKKWSIVALAVMFVITGFGIYSARNITINYNYENYFPQNDPTFEDYRTFTENFEADGEFLLIGIKNNEGIFDSTFLRKVKALGDTLKTQKNVNYLISPCHECYSYKMTGITQFEKTPCISFINHEKDSVAIFQNKKLIGSIFSSSGKAVTMYLTTHDKLNKSDGDELLDSVNKTLENFNFDESHISGRIVTTSHYTKQLGKELILFFSISVLLVSLFLWYAFRALWGVVVPLIIVISAMVWTVVIMKLTGKDFDLLMIMLPTIVFVVGMSDLIHFLNRYIDELRQGNEKLAAIKTSFKEVGVATLLTSTTTAIGFFSLMIVEIVPVKEFGLYSGISVIIAYVLTFVMLPLFLIILPIPKKLLQGKRKENWESVLTKTYQWVFSNKKLVYTGLLLLGILSLVGVNQLSVNNYLLEDLKESDPVKRDYRFFEQNFSGVRPFELELSIGKQSKNIYDFNTAQEIQKIENYLTTNYTDQGVGFIISPLDPIKSLYYIKHNNKASYFKLPRKEKTYLNQLYTLNNFKFSNNISFVTPDSTKARISGKIDDIGSLALKTENIKFEKFLNDSIDSSLITAKLTGVPLLIDKINERLSGSILLGLMLAFTTIAIIIGLVYKTWIIVIISMVVNTLPLIVVGGIMYVLGLDIKIST